MIAHPQARWTQRSRGTYRWRVAMSRSVQPTRRHRPPLTTSASRAAGRGIERHDARDKRNSPKRIGIEWQQLRASAALLIEWTRICHREGWLASAWPAQRERRSAGRRAVRRAYRFPELGQEALDSLLARRRASGLNEPYGPEAVAVYGDAANPLPPSERPGAGRVGSVSSRRRRAQNSRRAQDNRRGGGGRGGGGRGKDADDGSG